MPYRRLGQVWTMTQTITRLRGGAALRTGRPCRISNVMECAFVVEGRAAGAPLSDVDARRVGHMRGIVAAQLRYLGLASLVKASTLMVSELVTNAIEHGAGGVVTLSLLVTRAEVRVLVRDGGSGHPRCRTPSLDAESGRGLLIVEMLTAECGGTWGFDPGTRTTWCALPFSPGP